MSNVIPFSFEGRAVRVILGDNGEINAVGKDLCDLLGYADHTNAMKQHCKGVVKRHPLQTAGGVQEMRILPEPDIYRLIVNSTLPEAEKFERWLFEDVLPSIRKTGSYTMKQDKSGLPELRKAKAIELLAKTAERICGQFPSLGEQSRQVIFAKIVNPVAGNDVIPLPQLKNEQLTAEEVGARIGISRNMVGRLAAEHGLKTAEYGITVLGQSEHSAKQMPTFLYNEQGAAAIERAWNERKEKKGGGNAN